MVDKEHERESTNVEPIHLDVKPKGMKWRMKVPPSIIKEAQKVLKKREEQEGSEESTAKKNIDYPVSNELVPYSFLSRDLPEFLKGFKTVRFAGIAGGGVPDLKLIAGITNAGVELESVAVVDIESLQFLNLADLLRKENEMRKNKMGMELIERRGRREAAVDCLELGDTPGTVHIPEMLFNDFMIETTIDGHRHLIGRLKEVTDKLGQHVTPIQQQVDDSAPESLRTALNVGAEEAKKWLIRAIGPENRQGEVVGAIEFESDGRACITLKTDAGESKRYFKKPGYDPTPEPGAQNGYYPLPLVQLAKEIPEFQPVQINAVDYLERIASEDAPNVIYLSNIQHPLGKEKFASEVLAKIQNDKKFEEGTLIIVDPQLPSGGYKVFRKEGASLKVVIEY